MFEWFFSVEAWLALATLTALEIILGIDNIIFISILVGRLKEEQRNSARRIGLIIAMVTRLALLFSIAWVVTLDEPWFSILSKNISGKDIIMLGGGLFLIAKSTHEIHMSLEGTEKKIIHGTMSLGTILLQIAVLDIIFSLDSVITAVGLAKHISIMAIAIVVSVMIMLFAAEAIGNFVDRHPTIKMLALSFLIMVGFTLITEGFGVHVPKGYIYFAMIFSVSVEMLNLRVRKKQMAAIVLHKKYNNQRKHNER
jgi:predicted tellurium resistance membrane protein TerC